MTTAKGAIIRQGEPKKAIVSKRKTTIEDITVHGK